MPNNVLRAHTTEDVDVVTDICLLMHRVAVRIHARDHHNEDICPYFPCNIVRDVAEVLSREYDKLDTHVTEKAGT